MTTAYDHYIGSKVLVSKETLTIEGQEYTEYDVAAEDTTIAAIKDEINTDGSGLHLRLWLPMTIGTMDLRSDRLNVSVERQKDGTFEITRVYIG